MSGVQPHHGRALARAVGLVGAVTTVVRVAPADIARLMRRSIAALALFNLLVATVAGTWILVRLSSLGDDAIAAVGLGAIGVMALVSIGGAVIVRRRVVKHVRWGYGPDGELVVRDDAGARIYPVEPDAGES